MREALAITILGSFCGLQSVQKIHQWADSVHIRGFLSKYFGIREVPCYSWLLRLLQLVRPESFNHCFINWVKSLIGESAEDYTTSYDGKTVCSTGKMKKYRSPLQIVSAHIAELGITFGQKTVSETSNEIPAVRELIVLLNLEGCMVVADALNCQKETAQAIIDAKADYLLNVKDNQRDLKQDIADYVGEGELRKTMETASTVEKNRGRIERRTAYITCDIDWLHGKTEWAGLACIGAINTQTAIGDKTTDEWHYYITSRELSAEKLLKHARLEWSVETMHWLLDVHFREDFCRIEDKNVQQNLNMIRKMVLNCIKWYKQACENKRPISNIMFDCLLKPENILPILQAAEN